MNWYSCFLWFLVCESLVVSLNAQDYGTLPKIPQTALLRDLNILQEGLENFHSGLYWYTTKDSIDEAFDHARHMVTEPLNELEFHRLIAPIIGLTREDHTNMILSDRTSEYIEKEAKKLPLVVKFLDRRMYIVRNGSAENLPLRKKEVLSINGQTIPALVANIGRYFASDGYVKAVKYSDLDGANFAQQYFLVYGKCDTFQVEVSDSLGRQTYQLEAVAFDQMIQNIEQHYDIKIRRGIRQKVFMKYEILEDSIAYVAVHSFDNKELRRDTLHGRYKKFLRKTFADIKLRNIQHLILDISENGGGHEGNENLLFSYLGNNYQKYDMVRVKNFVYKIDNGVDKPIRMTTRSWFEKLFFYDQAPEENTYQRKLDKDHGLMAYKKEPQHKYHGKLYVLISPVTYSGGSELANMLFTTKRGIFIGEETGGGYYGNTSGLSYELTLPNSGITVDIPALQYKMNVKGGQFGRGVIPDHPLVPTINQYLNRENTVVQYTLNLIHHNE